MKVGKEICLHGCLILHGSKTMLAEKVSILTIVLYIQKLTSPLEEIVRDLGNSTNVSMTIGHYIASMEKLTRQWTSSNYRDPKRQRLYLKDIDCPKQWATALEKSIPQILFYLNESVGEKGGLGAQAHRTQYGHSTYGKGIAPAGDLMSNLPPEMRAENMMCYIGHEGTYTPAHREMCATLGQNIMVEASEVEKGEKPGSSIWFMTESKDREVVSEYFLSMLGHDVEVESHFAQINAWKKAPFPVYVVEQKVGDFILIPPLAPHQVWNRGTRTMKAAWNRTTVETLELAIHEALPRARMVCRDEQYKCKAIIYYSLLSYAKRLRRAHELDEANYISEPIRVAPRVKQIRKDFKRLFTLYTEILLGESFPEELPSNANTEFIEFDSNVTCSYCRCNIFNRFLTCKTCIGELVNGEEDTYDVCMECYAMGRSCGCLSNLTWVEQWSWVELMKHHSEWRALIVEFDGGYETERSPAGWEASRDGYGKKSVAQICQEQLKLRPWRDINKAFDDDAQPEEPPSQSETEADEDGHVKKRRKTNPKRKSAKHFRTSPGETRSCHICLHHDWVWKLAVCTECSSWYCYGTLWRAFDLKPQDVMQDLKWRCPKCLGICSCGRCRKSEKQKSYRPKGTLLGHDTKKVSDPRSVESLVDFSRTNLGWLRGEGDDDPKNSERMRLLKEKADSDKVQHPLLDDDHVGPVAVGRPSKNLVDQATIDPMLGGMIEIRATTSGLREGREGNIMLSQSLQDLGPGQGGTEVPVSYLFNDEYLAPEAPMLAGADSIYPDPSISRMMGQGYYQQSGGIDSILFDHPNSETFMGQDENISYPRLEIEPELLLKSNKRKADQANMNDDATDIARKDFIYAQRKQKSNEAKKNDKLIMTRHQLEGRPPLIVKLSMSKYKGSLQRLEELDYGGQSARQNPRPRRATESGRLPLEESLPPVKSDVQKSTSKRKNTCQDLSEDENDDEVVVEVRSKTKPTASTVKGSTALSFKPVRVSSKKRPPMPVKSDMEHQANKSSSTKTLAQRTRRRRPSRLSTDSTTSLPVVEVPKVASIKEKVQLPFSTPRSTFSKGLPGQTESRTCSQHRRKGAIETETYSEHLSSPNAIVSPKPPPMNLSRHIEANSVKEFLHSRHGNVEHGPQTKHAPLESSPKLNSSQKKKRSHSKTSMADTIDLDTTAHRPTTHGPLGLAHNRGVQTQVLDPITSPLHDGWRDAKLQASREAEEEIALEAAAAKVESQQPPTTTASTKASKGTLAYKSVSSAESEGESSSDGDGEDEIILSRPAATATSRGSVRRGIVPTRARGKGRGGR